MKLDVVVIGEEAAAGGGDGGGEYGGSAALAVRDNLALLDSLATEVPCTTR